MNIVAFAYNEVGISCLEELIRLGHTPRLVVTHPDSPDEKIWFRSVKSTAEKANIPLVITENPNQDEIVRQVRNAEPDLIFSFYFRRLLEPQLLGLARRAALNMHGSLLPKFRGRCPINWVLIHGEKETGVTLHHMTDKPDQGDIVSQRRFPILDSDSAATLAPRIAEEAKTLLRETWPVLVSGKIPRIPQNEQEATYFGSRWPEDGLIQWDRPAVEIHNLIRAVTYPYPGAFTIIKGRKLFIWKARPVDGEWPDVKAGKVLELRPGQGVLFSTAQGGLLAEIAQWDGGPEKRADLLL